MSKGKNACWTDNLIEYYKNNTLGICPKCNSKNVEVTESVIGRKSLNFICKDCGSTAHFDGTIMINVG